jgi:hypothetical protein
VIKSIFPIQDASLYKETPKLNSGLDEILEAGKPGTGSNAIRSLLQFDITDISASLASGTLPISTQFFLKLYIANSVGLEASQTIYTYPVSQSWSEGTGYATDLATNPSDGATWSYRTGVVAGLPWTGSTFYTTLNAINYEATYTFGYPFTDPVLDISKTVRAWVSGTFANNGVVVKISDNQESNTGSIAHFSFFSQQTHTIYQPKIISSWNSQSFITGSLLPSDITNSSIGLRNLQPTYSPNSIVRVNIGTREKYPPKSFLTASAQYRNTQYLPSTSYYAIIDDETKTRLVDYTEATRISCDSSGSYFYMSTSGLFPTRTYKILLRVITTDIDQVIDTQMPFRIINE